MIRVNDGELRARLAQTVSYYDPIDKTDKTKADCLVVDSTATRWEDDWYVVTGSVRIDSRVRVSGNVNLILVNGAELLVPKGISVPMNANFTVWGQIEDYIVGDDYEQAGHLETSAYDANGNLIYSDRYHAGIGGDFDGEEGNDCGNITINGGRITAFGGNYGPGIGSTAGIASDYEAITINNGLIISYGGPTDDGDAYSGAGIGGGLHSTSPRIIINGGGIYAQASGGAAGIGGGYSGYYRPITITGGEVFAYGSPFAAGIGLGAFDHRFYTGSPSSSLGGGLIDIQGGKVVAVSMLRNDKTYIQQGDDPHGIDTGAGAFVYGDRNPLLAFLGGVHLYDDAKVTYVRNFVSESEGGPEPEVVFSSGNAYTEDDLTERVWILMNSYKVTVEPCDHAGAAYVPASLTPSLGHIMHCATCNLAETLEVHTYDRTGKCALCGWYDGATVTVTFDSDGGSAVASQTVVSGYKAVEPDDPAKDGFAFKGWYQVTGGMTAETAFDFDTAVTGDITLKAVWVTSPTFATVNLILSGKIGLSFNMCLPEINGVDYTTSWMTFTIPHGTVTERVNYADSESKESGNRAFAAYVNSIQMAEPVTATFHYLQSGVEKTVTKTCAVRDYFDGFDAAVSQGNVTDEKTIALTHAVADYGHYVQPFLAEAHQWSLGEDYATMTKHYTEAADFNMEAIKTAAADHAIVNTNQTNGDIAAVTYSLTLESETAINVYFRPAPGYRGTPTATVDGRTAEVETVGGVYCVRITGIAAHKLSDSYVIVLTTGEGRTVTVRVSALSYVNTALNYYNDTTNEFHMKARNAVAAIYAYSQAADAYKTAHPNG